MSGAVDESKVLCPMGRNHELKLLSLSNFALWGEIRFIAFRDRTRPPFGKTSLAPYLLYRLLTI